MAATIRLIRIGRTLLRIVAFAAVYILLGSPGCGTKSILLSGHRPSGTPPGSGAGTEQAGSARQSGAVPCMDRTTGRSNPLAYMDVADTGSGNVDSGRYGNTRNGGGRFHAGIDLDAAPGTAAYSATDGQVIAVHSSARWDSDGTYKDQGGGYGNYVVVRSVVNGQTVTVRYAHLDVDGVDVRPGQTVSAGEVIGRTGRTGNAYNVPNPHLHFEVRDASGRAVNPEPYLNGQVSESGAFVNVACDNRDDASTVI